MAAITEPVPQTPDQINDDILRVLEPPTPLYVLAVLFCALQCLAPLRAAETPNVAAAADLKFALTEIAAAHQRAGGSRVNLSFGSSGVFRRQIAQGAPFELYLSADEAYVDALIAEGRVRVEGRRVRVRPQ